ncbi:hypothetical protein BD408DRAFT_415176 [Parasitella parasitica]|nr:hypothetical protein BD408DRAFT_415176 [Parasitella parasitica]
MWLFWPYALGKFMMVVAFVCMLTLINSSYFCIFASALNHHHLWGRINQDFCNSWFHL